MNEAKMSRLESGINGVAKKVLEAIPYEAPWSKDQIAAEVRRLGYGIDKNVIEGCLDTLRGRGLVKEPERGRFARIRARAPVPSTPLRDALKVAVEKSEPAKSKVEVMQTNVRPIQPIKSDVVDELGKIAERVRMLNQALDADALEAIAKEIDNAAIDVAEKMQKLEAETEAGRKLKDLLKAFSAA